ncbi:MAG TPA: transketolase C-terminal domain-containing protein, partial [Oscillospiraceae bacterium]|nr:transketolase C-terminal domain-containing protein [Oscillospiraceae bacterium]
VLLHEGPKVGGVGAEFSAMVSEDAFEYLSAPVKRVTSLDTPVPFAPCLEDRVMPQLNDLLETCREVANY